MRGNPILSILEFFMITSVLFAVPSERLVVYKAPEAAEPANDFQVEVDGQRLFVYNTRLAALAYFSFEGSADIKVKFGGSIENHDIRPKQLKIASTVYRDEIHFQLNEPANISVEVNRNLKRPLFLFANPLETEVPQKDDPNVVYFESGKIHQSGTIRVKSGQTVYIEGGAIVRGSFIADQGENIKIIGRGILDSSRYLKGEVRPIEINRSQDVLLEGIILTESRHWSCPSFASKNVTYRNIKIVSANDWDDGIDIVGSQNVLVDNCFIRTKDDCIAIKAGVSYFTDFDSGFDVDGITVQNSVLWNGAWGNGLEIGFETRTETIQNIVFRNCDLIHVEGPEGTFTIHNGDRAVVKNVLYEDIRVEDSRGYLIDFKILESQYSKDQQRGYIQDIHFRNIQVEGDVFPTSVIMGFDEEHKVSGVVLEDVRIHGRPIKSTYDGLITIIHAEGIEYR
jgi:pectate lyase